MAVGLGDHRLERAAVVLLDLAAAPELALGLLQAGCEPIADTLEVGDAEHSGAAAGGDAPLDATARERGGEELAEAALERCDLAPQLVAQLALGGDSDAGTEPAGAGKRLRSAVDGAIDLRLILLK